MADVLTSGNYARLGLVPSKHAALGAYEPTVRDRIGNWVYDNAKALGLPAQAYRAKTQFAADFVLGLGDYLGAEDAKLDYDKGNYGSAALGGVLTAAGALLPAVKPVRKMLKKYPIASRGEWYGDANYKETGGKIVEMSPDEYLSQVRPLEIDEVSQENIDILAEHMTDGKTLDPLAIYQGGKEDGRHRAYAAKKLGIEKVPVLTWGDELNVKGNQPDSLGSILAEALK